MGGDKRTPFQHHYGSSDVQSAIGRLVMPINMSSDGGTLKASGQRHRVASAAEASSVSSFGSQHLRSG